MTMRKPKRETSWEGVGRWYNKSVGREGHYYHQNIVLPGVIRLLDIKSIRSLVDLGCGQGVLARQLPSSIEYLGVDLSKQLIAEARKLDPNQRHKYIEHDITEPLPNVEKPLFDAAALVLSLQNVEKPDEAIRNLKLLVRPGGRVVIVLNHPCFRIPRQSFWQIDDKKQCRYRRLERYLSPLQIPIQMSPSKGEESPVTWSFHHPLSSYSRWLGEAGFCITALEEWCSDKVSTGAAARMENLSRKEFPLFLAICARRD